LDFLFAEDINPDELADRASLAGLVFDDDPKAYL